MKTLITISDISLKRILFSTEALEKLYAISEVHWIEEGKIYSVEELKNAIPQYDACITSWHSPKFTSEVLNEAVNLKFIGHAAGTVVPIMDEDIFQKKIVVVNANNVLARSTAEHTVGLMMAGAWNHNGFNLNLKRGIWGKSSEGIVMGLYKQTIGLIGYGCISKEVIRLLKPYDVEILLYSKHCNNEEADALGVKLVNLEKLLKESQIISLHNTLTDSTKGMFGKKELSLIKDGALLVNTSRAAIIEERALIESLSENRYFAAIDVYHTEPLSQNYELLKLKNVFCTPHIGGFSSYWRSKFGEIIIDDLIRWTNGEKVQGEITLEMFRRLTPK